MPKRLSLIAILLTCAMVAASHPRVSTIFISCMDYRLQPWLEKVAHDHYGGRADRITLAGASRCILDARLGPAILSQLELAISKHGVEEVVLIHHTDCGGYELKSVTKQQERDIHQRDMEKVREVILKKFPRVKRVTLYLVDIEAEKVHTLTPHDTAAR